MPKSELRLIKRWQPFVSESEVKQIPGKLRGIYVLYKYMRKTRRYNVVYVGMAVGSIRHRLNSHKRNKAGLWTHFSVFEVWDKLN